MPNCMICKDTVTSGFVVCGHCAKKLEPYTLTPELSFYIDQLAESIVLSNTVHACGLCAIGDCAEQVSGLTCRNGVKAWLLQQAQNTFKKKACA